MIDISKMVFSTNLSYRKIATYGELTTTGTGTYIRDHNLGYIPGFSAWCESWVGIITPAIAGESPSFYAYDGSMAECLVWITTTQIVFEYTGAAGRKIIWRVYYDD